MIRPVDHSTNNMALVDFKGLAQLKRQAQANANEAAQETAQQFEALFVQTMLKTMRLSQHFLDENSPFRSQSSDTFQEMLDAQYAQNISKNGGIGLAKALAGQLASQNTAPAKNRQTSVPVTAFTFSIPTFTENIDSQTFADFVKPLLPYARKAAQALGVDVKILLAQVALETGWGKYIIKDENGNSTYNFFNIKAPAGQTADTVNIKTTEFMADKPFMMQQQFKKYANPAAGFDEYVALIRHSERYSKALQHEGDSRQFMLALQEAGYATDPKYAEKVLQIYDSEAIQNIERSA